MAAIQDVLKKFGDETVSIIQANLASTGTNASGATSKSVQSTQKDNRVTVTGRPFFYAVETGSGPMVNETKGNPTLQQSILGWIQTGKPGISENIEGASWAISKFIHKYGTKLFRDGGRDDIFTPAISEQRVDVLVAEIANVTQDGTVNELNKIIIG